MKKYSSHGKQRFHRYRDVLVPHGFISGFLLSINPLQENRALREAQSYFSTLTEDLQTSKRVNPSTNPPNDRLKATSALLAAELKSAIKADQKSRKRSRDEEDDPKSMWFSSVDISCKGFLLLRVPMINPSVTCCTVQVHGSCNESVDSSTSATEDSSLKHVIMINPLISHIVEQLFHDLRANPRPVFRHCFRLIPVELTCCPVLFEMKKALEYLLRKHFLEDDNNSGFHGKFTEPIGFSKSLSRKKSLTTVLFSFSVKNNTKVKCAQRAIVENLVRLFPLNQFTVLQRETGEIEAAVQVVVAQSTCLMGVQRCYSERSHFNVGEISRGAFPVDSLLEESKS